MRTSDVTAYLDVRERAWHYSHTVTWLKMKTICFCPVWSLTLIIQCVLCMWLSLRLKDWIPMFQPKRYGHLYCARSCSSTKQHYPPSPQHALKTLCKIQMCILLSGPIRKSQGIKAIYLGLWGRDLVSHPHQLKTMKSNMDKFHRAAIYGLPMHASPLPGHKFHSISSRITLGWKL